MDTKPCLYDIGWCFSFTLKSDDIRSLVIEFKKELLEKKASAFPVILVSIVSTSVITDGTAAVIAANPELSIFA